MRISSYEFGAMVVDGETHRRDVIIEPGRVDGGWRRKQGHFLEPDDLAAVWRTRPDVLVVGTGFYGRMRVPEATKEHARKLGVELCAAPSGEAVALFNDLEGGKRTVVGAFHLTC